MAEAAPLGDVLQATELLRRATDNIQEGFYVLDRDFRYLVFNRAAEAYFAAEREQLIGKCMWDVFPQGRGGEFEAACRAAMDEGRTTALTLPSRRHPERTVELIIAPVPGLGLSVSLIDITARKAADQALEESEARLDLATRASGMGVWEWRPGEPEILASERALAVWGFEPGERATVEGLRERIDPAHRAGFDAQARQALDPALRLEQPYEFQVVAADGRRRWVRAFGRAVFDGPGPDAAVVRYVGANEEITARKEAEERLQLLAREIDHRANNLLTVVQGLVTLTGADDPVAMKAALLGRISALAHAHQLLAQNRWTGADLRELVTEEMRPYELDGVRRVSIDGPPYRLRAQAAQSLAMVLHELATNAAKYGALSRRQGRVEIAWTAGAAGLALRWTETGGPPVAPPTRKGLGTSVLNRALAGAVNGQLELHWRPEGLQCLIELPPGAAAD